MTLGNKCSFRITSGPKHIKILDLNATVQVLAVWLSTQKIAHRKDPYRIGSFPNANTYLSILRPNFHVGHPDVHYRL